MTILNKKNINGNHPQIVPVGKTHLTIKEMNEKLSIGIYQYCVSKYDNKIRVKLDSSFALNLPTDFINLWENHHFDLDYKPYLFKKCKKYFDGDDGSLLAGVIFGKDFKKLFPSVESFRLPSSHYVKGLFLITGYFLLLEKKFWFCLKVKLPNKLELIISEYKTFEKITDHIISHENIALEFDKSTFAYLKNID